MRHAFVTFILILGLKSVIALYRNETQIPINATKDDSPSVTARQGRRIIEERIEVGLPGKQIKRQIITIPPSVSKVKLVQPPLNLRHSRGPQKFKRYPQMIRGPLLSSKKKTSVDYDVQFDDSYVYDSKKVKRNLKKPLVKGVSPQEFYQNEDFEDEGKKHRVVHKVVKIKRKKPKTNILGEYLTMHDGMQSEQESEKYDNSNPPSYGYDSAATSIHMKQVPPPNLFPLKQENVPELQKQPYSPEKPTYGHVYDENFIPAMNIKKLPSKSRQIQSLFSQQYTTHNPQVTTNFGLSSYGSQKGFHPDSTPYELLSLGKFNQPVGAASEQVVSSVPVLTPGIQVIQPPQFRDVTVSHPPQPSRLMGSSLQQKEETSSQRATIRDILDQDCPSYDVKGYCESPPRYPMQQISNMVKKCANLMEVMNTQPFEEPQEVYTFGKRSDQTGDNSSNATDLGIENAYLWSRSSTDDITACTSELIFIEPGYAREVTSGRWFVIVQHPDTTIQRIATDVCTNLGKPCSGLSGLKCTKVNGFPNKSTRCVQRFTYQRLISWDPEYPEGCPRMRVFRFPSACVCHLPA